MRACGLATNSLTLLEIKISFNSMALLFMTTHLIAPPHSQLTIPNSTFHISGTNIFLDTRTPTQNKLDTCPHLYLTSEVEWNPQTLLLPSTRSVEAEDFTTGNGNVEPGLSQISCVYSFLVMA
jgi:hypothetical protein